MADKKFLVDLDLNKNEIQNVVMQNLATAPANPKKGQHYFNTTSNTEFVWNGTAWVDALSQGDYTFSSPLSETDHVVTIADASTTQKGVIEIATDSEATTGTDTTRAITPKQLKTGLDGKVTKNADITAGTHTKITYDTKGLVTGGTDLTATDIPDLTLAKITDVTATAAEINVLDGMTATTAELNVLDGITATTAELNYTDGVTSNIQTQLNNRVVKNNNITAGTHTKITYDAKGLVTSGTDLSASDIPNLTLSKITDVTATAAEVNVLDGITTTTTELNYVSGVTSSIQTQIDALAGRGKLLAVWNPQTGLPSTNPGTLPYTYKTGDYYIVGNPGATNYKPTGTSYTGAASTTVETNTIAANDTYIFDGTSWTLLHTEQAATTWGSITGTLSSQTDLNNALNNKVTKNADITAGTGTKITYDAKGLVTGSSSLAAGDIPDLSSTYATASNSMTFSNKTINADDNTVSNLETDNFKSGVVQTTIRSTSTATDTSIASEKAIATALATKTGKLVVTNPAMTASGGVCTWTITNTLGSNDVSVIVKEVSTNEEVVMEVTFGTGTITLKMNSTANVTAGTYKAVIIG